MSFTDIATEHPPSDDRQPSAPGAEPGVCGRVSVHRFLQALYGCAPPRAFVEVRFLRERRMGRSFHPVDELDAVAETVLARCTVCDVFVGVVPRARCGGARADLIGRSHVVWADCDDADSLLALKAFRPAPSMVIASGSAQRCHAYWLLCEAIDLECTEQVNRGLALALGADERCAGATHILRVPDTLNFKHTPPARVELIEYTGAPRSAEDILAALPALAPRRPRDRPLRPADVRREDPLQQIKPADYVRLLTGRAPGADGKINCPFHDDRTPSLHVYGTPEQGWACYGCPTVEGKPRGGDIYVLGSLLWSIPARGRGFLDLRARLDDVFRVDRGVGRLDGLTPLGYRGERGEAQDDLLHR